MKISCIIPTYNEGKRILPVLEIVCGHPGIDEVIVVNDGSTDETHSLLENDTRIKFISYPKNKGKTYAVFLGIQSSRNETIMLIDSDLVGLQIKNIDDLISPINLSKADVSISLRGNSFSIYKKLGLDFVSGERVLNKKILGNIEDLLKNLKGFGLETFMNTIIVKDKLKIKVVSWPNVYHARKQEKVGYWKGLYKELEMIFHILKTENIFTLIKLTIKMRKLRVLD